MKKNFHLLIILCLVSVTGNFYSCKRDRFDPYLGPQSCPDDNFFILPGKEFVMNHHDGDLVNFTQGDSLYFTCGFSSPARWKVEISGVSSNARKVFEGFSDNFSFAWYGRPGSELFFKNEKINVVFSVLCRKDLSRAATLDIMISNFLNDPSVIYITDLDGIGIPLSSWVFYNDQDPQYGSAEADTAICPGTSKAGFCSPYKPSPQGGSYMSFIGTKPVPEGESRNIFSYYEIYPPNLSNRLPSDPSKIWFNFLASPGNTAVRLLVSFRHWNGVIRYGRKMFFLRNDQWQMYSINLGELDKIPGDEETFNAKELGIVLFTMIVQDGKIPAHLNTDMLTFTLGEPFFGK